jgi:hypothetical protein
MGMVFGMFGGGVKDLGGAKNADGTPAAGAADDVRPSFSLACMCVHA